ncbi:bifunctional phosphoribosylaminoimidazolecarboxamide formyltransferase/IMP cyclohydrolase [Candidatus Peregrinibacteria bacterium]|nr:bifunctional phosphoribosylaminoimidazolecarboxamide formyltransferase/IMP cyclohydrolase [Candidatus Peregrinibacteria bacterium]MBI3816150.1 bifunctional phosphoribosylaminoimidazolecarboxamide formyltransferase/IMP cyclohydrolase [Candidatus Peregrinibacteria bacterium]
MSKRALLSVSDKTGIVEFAQRLAGFGFDLLSTGGTSRALREAGIAVTDVESVTKFPECFGGRVKTIHPTIMGGILFRRGNPDDERQAKELGVEPIDLVCVNLYPFGGMANCEGRIANDGENSPLAIRHSQLELIDIGGPTLLRSAAKNHESVTVLCDPADYATVLEELEKKGETSIELRQRLAAKVFLHTAAYDAHITEHLSGGADAGILMTGGKQLRYGENPHQWAKYYEMYSDEERIAKGELRKECATRNSQLAIPSSWGHLHQGKEMSYLNILDADAAWDTVQEFADPTAVFVKHANPSGIASHHKIDEAFQRAYDADRLSAFGVIIALNRACTEAIARKIIDQKMFVEVIVAPAYESEALEILRQKPNIRVIEQVDGEALKNEVLYRSVLHGMLVQNRDNKIPMVNDLKCVTKKQPTQQQMEDLLFAWKCVKHAKSNAIVFVKDQVTVGIGAGQTSRVDATWIAAKRAGEKSNGAVMASDAFFPFPDSVEEAAKHGIAAIIQPGGSIRDEEIFKRADELGLVMVLTGVRAFRH